MKFFLYLLIFIYVALTAVTSCQSKDPREVIVSTILEMGNHKTNLPISDMICWKGDSIGRYVDSINRSKLKLIVYADTSDCSLCFLNHLSLWNDFLPLEKKYNGAISFVFIIEARQNESSTLYNQLLTTGLNHPIFIDDKLSFRKSNPHIPKEALYHTFVLDEKNNIVLVGNPLKNEEIEKLLYELIETKCSRTHK